MARTWGALWIVYIVWGSTYLAIDRAIVSIPSLFMLATRFVLAGVVLYAVVGRRVRTTPRQWLAATGIGTLLLSIGTGGVAFAEQRLDTGLVALIVAIVPLWVAVLDRVVWGKRLTRGAAAGIAIGLVGVALLVDPTGASGRERVGALVPIVGSFCWAFGSLWARTAPLPEQPLVAGAMEMIGGGGVLLGASFALREDGSLGSLTGESLAGGRHPGAFGPPPGCPPD